MSGRNQERILEAIDQLRRRKARPDGQRICNYLFRRFSVSNSEARADLERCVDAGVVFRVEYKGSISYRNAARKPGAPAGRRRKPSAPEGSDSSAPCEQFAQLLTDAIGELIVAEPDYLELGVPGDEIALHVLARDSVRYTGKYIAMLLQREVAAGGLVEVERGKYLLGPRQAGEAAGGVEVAAVVGGANGNRFVIHVRPRKKPGPKPKEEREERAESEEGEKGRAEVGGSLRVGGRRKRAKKVFDPSDTHVPKKRGRPAGSLNKATIEKQLARLSDDSRPESRSSSRSEQAGGVCSVCRLQNKKGPNERLISCRECSNKAHVSCLNGDDMMLKIYPDNSWQCSHCKSCVVCCETADAGSLIVCTVCADGYHAGCHEPALPEPLRKGRFVCTNCEMPDQLKINEIQPNLAGSYHRSGGALSDQSVLSASSISGRSTPAHFRSPPLSPTPPRLSPQNEYEPNGGGASDSLSLRGEEDDPDVDPSIPDATNWTTEEVYQYFVRYFPKEAKIFREQEIDGRSLLLMTRMDVLTNLRLNLGPALKIYRHVVKLQVRKDDPKYYWL